jgi:radical SAM superfamily enzyme YgiQ (UPF0313 family)
VRILLVLPDGRINKLKIGPLDISFREAPLTATTLAALVPRELDAKVVIVDRSVGQPVPYRRPFDLVGISIMTGTSSDGYEIADRFRALGVPVVLGGVHATLLPEEAAAHADVVVRGFAERSWPRLLRDFAAGHLQRRYCDGGADLEGLPDPRRDLQKPLGYLIPNTVLITRGCRGRCDFCSVPAANFGFTKRPVGEVIEEIRRLRGARFAVSDVHVTQDVEYARELFEALIPLKKKWGALVSPRVVDEPGLLELMKRSGCSYLLLGFESVNSATLRRVGKSFDQAERYTAVVERLHELGITIQGCFIFGFDEDEPSVFAHTLEWINEVRVDIPRFALYTPYPNTRLFRRLRGEGRILHTNWKYYDTQHVVIRPLGMSPVQLESGFQWVWRECFRLLPSLRRSLGSGWNMPITFLGNLAYQLYIRRLCSDTDRFPVSAEGQRATA